MSKKHTVAVIVVVLAVGAGTIYWISKTTRSQTESQTSPESLQNSPVARVQTTLLARRKIKETIVAYGTVAAALGKTQAVSVPFESQVREVKVTAGQVVDANTPLIDIAPGPESRFGLEQARAERETEKNNLDLVTRRLEMKLATRQDLNLTQQNFQAAQLKVKTMEEQGIGGQKIILAPSRVLINQINVSQGQIVSPGTVLIEIIGENQLSVHLGVENEEITAIKPGQPVQLYQVNASEEKMIGGTIGLITQQVNPQTRLIDVFVFPESGTKLLLNEYIKACIVIESDPSFVVPRSAILPGDEKYILYTVEKGRAVKHEVTIGLENADQIQVYGEDLREGQQVVVTGNYELENSMPVQVEQQ